MNEQELAELFNSIVANNQPVVPEFRLYYNDQGDPTAYACEDLPGNYIIIDRDTYARGRYDCKVIDGEIVYLAEFAYYNKVAPADSGTAAHPTNALLIEPTSTVFWSLKTTRVE